METILVCLAKHPCSAALTIAILFCQCITEDCLSDLSYSLFIYSSVLYKHDSAHGLCAESFGINTRVASHCIPSDLSTQDSPS